MARIEATKKGLSIYGYHEYPLSLGPGRDKQIELIEILRVIRGTEPDSDIRYCVSLPLWAVSTRLKSFPFRERVKILKATPFELEDELPINQDDAI